MLGRVARSLADGIARTAGVRSTPARPAPALVAAPMPVDGPVEAADVDDRATSLEAALERAELEVLEFRYAIDRCDERVARAKAALEGAERSNDVAAVTASDAELRIATRTRADTAAALESAERGADAKRRSLADAKAESKRAELLAKADADAFHDRARPLAADLYMHVRGVLSALEQLDTAFGDANQAARAFVAAGGDPGYRELDAAHVLLDLLELVVERSGALNDHAVLAIRHATSPRMTGEPAIAPRRDAVLALLAELVSTGSLRGVGPLDSTERTRRRLQAMRTTRTVAACASRFAELEAGSHPPPAPRAPYQPPARRATTQRPETRGRPGFTVDEIEDLADDVREAEPKRPGGSTRCEH